MGLLVERCTKADFDQIVGEVAAFWGSDRTRRLHHPMLFYEFGDTAFVIREGDTVVAYLFGYLAQTGARAYVHLVAVRESHRRRGLARQLYEQFIAAVGARGCTELKATTRPWNRDSIAFHTSLGMEMLGEEKAEGVRVVRDYAGPGEDRVVFWRRI